MHPVLRSLTKKHSLQCLRCPTSLFQNYGFPRAWYNLTQILHFFPNQIACLRKYSPSWPWAKRIEDYFGIWSYWESESKFWMNKRENQKPSLLWEFLNIYDKLGRCHVLLPPKGYKSLVLTSGLESILFIRCTICDLGNVLLHRKIFKFCVMISLVPLPYLLIKPQSPFSIILLLY